MHVVRIVQLVSALRDTIELLNVEACGQLILAFINVGNGNYTGSVIKLFLLTSV